MTKPSICLVAPNLYPVLVGDGSKGFAGGAEVQQNFIARGLAARGYRVTVVTSDFGQENDHWVDGIRVIKIAPSNSGLPFIRFFHPGMTNFWRALWRADADIYYQRSAGWPTGLVARFCKQNERRFIYAAAHDLDLIKDQTHKLFNYPLAWRARYLYQYGVRNASVIVAQTVVQREACRTWHGRAAVQISSGYSKPIVQRQINGIAKSVLWVAALRKWKRPELFLELARRLPRIQFHMIGGAEPGGDGNVFFNKIKAEAAQLSNLTFHGFLPLAEADAQFDNACIFVNTSDNEGFPNTFLQAWSRGVPTVSFVDCGAKDSVGPIGKTVSSLDAMVAAVELLTTDVSARSADGHRAQQHFERHHSVSAVIDQYEQLFSGLMAKDKTWR